MRFFLVTQFGKSHEPSLVLNANTQLGVTPTSFSEVITAWGDPYKLLSEVTQLEVTPTSFSEVITAWGDPYQLL